MADKKKILICIDWFAPGYKAGGPIQSCVNFVRAMEDCYDLYVLTTNLDFGATEPYPNIEPNRWIPFSENTNVLYLSKTQLNPRTIQRHIQTIQPDFLYLNSLFSFYFSILPLLLHQLGFIKTKIILSPRGMLRSSALAYKSQKKKVFLRLSKWMGLYKAVRFHATDEQELNDIKRLLPLTESVNAIKEVQLVPNLSKAVSGNAPDFIKKEIDVLRLIFVGRIHPIKNLNFVLEVLTAIKDAQIIFTIIGNLEDDAYWKQCQASINKLPNSVKVDYIGGVASEQIETYLIAHHFLILPTFGENFGHAIFEAFIAGRPVIISDQTPWRGLAAKQAGFDLSLQKKEDWIHTIEQAAQMNQETYDIWTMGAWCFAKAYLKDSNVKAKYIALFS